MRCPKGTPAASLGGTAGVGVCGSLVSGKVWLADGVEDGAHLGNGVNLLEGVVAEAAKLLSQARAFAYFSIHPNAGSSVLAVVSSVHVAKLCFAIRSDGHFEIALFHSFAL